MNNQGTKGSVKKAMKCEKGKFFYERVTLPSFSVNDWSGWGKAKTT